MWRSTARPGKSTCCGKAANQDQVDVPCLRPVKGSGEAPLPFAINQRYRSRPRQSDPCQDLQPAARLSSSGGSEPHGTPQKPEPVGQQPGAATHIPLSQSEPVEQGTSEQNRSTQAKRSSRSTTHAQMPSGPQFAITPASQFSPVVHSPLTRCPSALAVESLNAAATRGVEYASFAPVLSTARRLVDEEESVPNSSGIIRVLLLPGHGIANCSLRGCESRRLILGLIAQYQSLKMCQLYVYSTNGLRDVPDGKVILRCRFGSAGFNLFQYRQVPSWSSGRSVFAVQEWVNKTF